MDISTAFIEAALEYVPNAAVTFDRFHVMNMAKEALDALRREEARTNPALKCTRYRFLRHPDTLTQTQVAKLAAA